MGHDAWSCDIIPSEKPGNHIQDDVLNVLDMGWDLAVFHPPCDRLCLSGLHWNNRGRGWEGTESGLRLVAKLLNAPIPLIALENSKGCIPTRIARYKIHPEAYGRWHVFPRDHKHDKTRFQRASYAQVIQPYEFGHDASKATCLWLKGLS